MQTMYDKSRETYMIQLLTVAELQTTLFMVRFLVSPAKKYEEVFKAE